VFNNQTQAWFKSKLYDICDKSTCESCSWLSAEKALVKLGRLNWTWSVSRLAWQFCAVSWIWTSFSFTGITNKQGCPTGLLVSLNIRKNDSGIVNYQRTYESRLLNLLPAENPWPLLPMQEIEISLVDLISLWSADLRILFPLGNLLNCPEKCQIL